MSSFPGIASSEVIDWAAAITGPLMIKGTGTAYTWTGTGTSTGVIDADYPGTTVRGLQYLDGSFYVMEPDGTIHNSVAAGDDPTDWPTDGFISAQFEPDSGVFLGKALNYIVAFGAWTTELFWDAANATGSPLLPVQNGVLLIGCASANSVAQSESTLIWMAQRKAQNSTQQQGRFIAMLTGTSYDELSTPDICRVLEADDLASVRSCIIELGGHSWYVLTLGTSAITLVYDMKNKHWYVWTRLAAGSSKTISSITQTNGLVTAVSTAHGISDGDPVVTTGISVAGMNGTFNVNVPGTNSFTYPTPLTGTSTGTGGSMTAIPYSETAFAMVASLGFNNQQVVMDTAGNVYSLSMTTALDDGNLPINWRIRTQNLDEGNNERKFCHSLAVLADVAGTATGMVRFSDDDYRTFGYFRRFDLSQVRCNQQRWGNFRRRVWEWRYTDRERLRVKALEADLTQGAT